MPGSENSIAFASIQSVYFTKSDNKLRHDKHNVEVNVNYIEFLLPGMKQCEICGKGSRMVGKRIKLRGKYNPTIKKRKYPNLQKAVTPDGRKVLACASCIKGFSKQTARVR